MQTIMDIHKAQELSKVADQQIKVAEEYALARKEAGDAQASLDLLVAAELSTLRGQKKNLGIEMARLMLIEESLAARSFYEQWIKKEAIYKGLEKILEARASKISLEQSIMKYQKEGERYG